MLNSRRFLDTFVNIEMLMKERLKDSGFSFVRMVHDLSQKDPIVKHYKYELLEFAQLRNAIVHNRTSNNQAIAEPHDEIVSSIEAIYKELESPLCLKDLNFSKPFISNPFILIDELAYIQEQHNYSVVPIYQENEYLGSVHARLYQRTFYYPEKEFKTGGDLLEIDTYYNRIIFLSHKDPVLMAVERFNYFYQKGRPLIAVLVTEDAKQHAPVLGILTPADLPWLMDLLE